MLECTPLIHQETQVVSCVSLTSTFSLNMSTIMSLEQTAQTQLQRIQNVRLLVSVMSNSQQFVPSSLPTCLTAKIPVISLPTCPTAKISVISLPTCLTAKISVISLPTYLTAKISVISLPTYLTAKISVYLHSDMSDCIAPETTHRIRSDHHNERWGWGEQMMGNEYGGGVRK